MAQKKKQASNNVSSMLPEQSTKKIRLEDDVENINVENVNKVEVDTQASGSKNTKAERARRGKTRMHCLSIQRGEGVKKRVKFNERGQTTCPVGTQMQSYIGVLARERVKITYDDWRDVPDEVKLQIWESVKMLFIVPESWKEKCFKSACSKWRQFKSKLYKTYISDKMESSCSSELNTPPPEYPFIQASDWSEFLFKRLGDSFKKLSKVQKDRRSKIIYRYRLARKGYAKYASEHPELISDDPDADQSMLWVAARKDKDGNFPSETPGLDDTTAKIDELISDKKQGTLHLKVSKGTILENVLGKREHPGRVRGVGCDMTQTSYFKVYRGNKLNSELCSRQHLDPNAEEREQQRDERIARLEAAVFKNHPHDAHIEQKGSCSVKMKSENEMADIDDATNLGEDDVKDFDEDVQLLDKNEALQGKLVTLSAESGIKIAHGTIVKANRLGVQLPEDCIRVSIDEIVDENATLPIPSADCKNIGDALGCHVTWPMHLLKLKDEKAKQKKKQEKREPAMDYSKIPLSLRMVYCYCKALENGNGTVQISIPKEVFGEQRTIYLHHKDVEPFCQLQPIQYNCVAVYLWHMYKKLQSLEKVKTFRFVDPYYVGYVPSKKADKTLIKKGVESRASSLAQALSGTLADQVALVPCNVGNHWILTIINPHNKEIGLLDPLYKGIHNEDWREVVELALNVHASGKRRTERKGNLWTVFQVPKQPDSVQCGFYVMKYIKEIVEVACDNSVHSLQKMFDKRLPYSIADIDEVRKEWAKFVQSNIE